MTIDLTVKLQRVQPEETIPHGALHTLDGITFYPIVNPEATVGQKAKEFKRKFYVIISAFKIEE